MIKLFKLMPSFRNYFLRMAIMSLSVCHQNYVSTDVRIPLVFLVIFLMIIK